MSGKGGFVLCGVVKSLVFFCRHLALLALDICLAGRQQERGLRLEQSTTSMQCTVSKRKTNWVRRSSASRACAPVRKRQTQCESDSVDVTVDAKARCQNEVWTRTVWQSLPIRTLRVRRVFVTCWFLNNFKIASPLPHRLHRRSHIDHIYISSHGYGTSQTNEKCDQKSHTKCLSRMCLRLLT
jgi:hypothetical protein